MFKNQLAPIILLVLFSAFLFSVGLGAMPLTDPDEVFYAETAREMLSRQEFLTPFIFGEPQFEKPPFYYWLVIISYKIFGITEFAARVSSAILGILGIIGIFLLGRILINKKAGFFSAIVLATNINYIILARACVTDMALCVFILYALLFFFYGFLSERGKTKWYLLSSIFLGLSTLTKGPIGVFLPVAIIGGYLIFTRQLKRIKGIPFVRGAALFLAVSLPWYFLMHRAHGREFIDVFFGFHNVIRFLHPEHKIGDVVYYYVPVILGGFLPWTAFLPIGIWKVIATKSADENLRKTNIFLLVWFLVVFVFFSASRTKLPTYIFPLYPALALFIGKALAALTAEDLSPNLRKFMNVSLGLFFISVLGGIIGISILTFVEYRVVAKAAFVAGILFAIFVGLALLWFARRKYFRSFLVFMVSFVIFMGAVSYTVLPEIGRHEASKEISEKALAFMKPGEKLGAETQYQRGVAFYTKREDIPDVHNHHIITTFLKNKERVWCIIKEKNHIQLYTNTKYPYKQPTYVVYRLGKRVIITNTIPDDGKFIKMRNENDY